MAVALFGLDLIQLGEGGFDGGIVVGISALGFAGVDEAHDLFISGGEEGIVAVVDDFKFFLVFLGFSGGFYDFIALVVGGGLAEVAHDFDIGDAGGFESVPNLEGVIFHGSTWAVKQPSR